MTASPMRPGVIWTMFVVVSVVCLLGGCATEKKPAAEVTAGKQPAGADSPDYPDTSRCDGLAVEKIEENYPDGALGRIREVVKLDDGTYVSHGVTTLFAEEGGGKKAELDFVCGVRHGKSRTWYPDGSLRGEGQYVNGKGHGEWKTWYPNGALQQQFTLDHGAWRGPFTQWFPSGQKRVEVEWVDGRKQGPEIYWNEEGKEIKRIDYVDGVPQPGGGPTTE